MRHKLKHFQNLFYYILLYNNLLINYYSINKNALYCIFKAEVN